MNLRSFRSATEALDYEIELTLAGFEPRRVYNAVTQWWHVLWSPR